MRKNPPGLRCTRCDREFLSPISTSVLLEHVHYCNGVRLEQRIDLESVISGLLIVAAIALPIAVWLFRWHV